MSLNDLIQADNALFVNTSDFARSVTYRAVSGLETSFDAVVFEAESQEDDNNGITTVTRTRSITFDASLTQIDSTGVVVIDGADWAVTPQSTTDGFLTSVVLKRFELLEQGRPNLRRR